MVTVAIQLAYGREEGPLSIIFMDLHLITVPNTSHLPHFLSNLLSAVHLDPRFS